MARNKHPEVTEERILDVAQQLFLEKGYENTTIQDIVDGLGGLTKGAVVPPLQVQGGDHGRGGGPDVPGNNPFEAVQGRTDLNAWKSSGRAIRLNQSDQTRTRWTVQAIPLTYSPRIPDRDDRANRRILTPYYQALLEEGNRDGSLRTDYPGNWRNSSPSSPAVAAALGVPRHQGRDEAKVPVSGGDAGGDGGPPLRREHPESGGPVLRPDPGGPRPPDAKIRLPQRQFYFPLIHSFGRYEKEKEVSHETDVEQPKPAPAGPGPGQLPGGELHLEVCPVHVHPGGDGSATLFSGLLALSMVPTILLSPFGGMLADRADRRKVMVALDALSGLLVLLAGLVFSISYLVGDSYNPFLYLQF